MLGRLIVNTKVYSQEFGSTRVAPLQNQHFKKRVKLLINLVAGARSRLASLFSCCVEVKEDKYSIFRPIQLNYNGIVHEAS